MGERHLGVKKRAEDSEKAWRQEHLRQSERDKQEDTTIRRVERKIETTDTTTAATTREKFKMGLVERMSRCGPLCT